MNVMLKLNLKAERKCQPTLPTDANNALAFAPENLANGTKSAQKEGDRVSSVG